MFRHILYMLSMLLHYNTTSVSPFYAALQKTLLKSITRVFKMFLYYMAE